MSGDAKYSAEVVVGITKGGEAVFYDVVDMTPTVFDIKKEESSTAATTQNAIGAIHEDSVDPIISQKSEKSSGSVKNSSEESSPLHSLSSEDELPVRTRRLRHRLRGCALS